MVKYFNLNLTVIFRSKIFILHFFYLSVINNISSNKFHKEK